jgi:hypothetical protein
MSHVVHTIPVNDLIEHVTDDDSCPCGPTCVPIELDDGSIAFQYLHHSLDGREFHESDTSFTCPICRMTSYNPNDIEHGYCGNCHAFTRGSVLVELEMVTNTASNNWEWMPLPLKVVAIVILAAVACGLVWLIFFGEI